MTRANHQKKKKKRRSRASNQLALNGTLHGGKNEEEGIKGREGLEIREDNVNCSLIEAFASASLEEATAACREANGDPEKAAEILFNLVENGEDSVSSGFSGPDSRSSSGSGPGSISSEGFMETGCIENAVPGRGFRRNQQKRVVATTGMVSTMLGKEYVRSGPRKQYSPAKFKGLDGNGEEILDREGTEQLLYSMLGDDCELSMAVVKDVLCQCGYNFYKALDVLLDLSATSSEQSVNGRCLSDSLNYKKDKRFNTENGDNLEDRPSNCVTHFSESKLQDSKWSMNGGDRDYLKVLTTSEAPSPTSPRSRESNLPLKVLESLFNLPRSTEREPDKMDWRNVAKKMQSLGPGFDVYTSSVAELEQDTYVKGDEYHAFRKTANQHWGSMRSYYRKAARAHSNGEQGYAAYLSDQGKTENKLAWKADERASHNIFKARNRGIENVITIDLHGQHVKQAMKILKMHLILGSYVPSVQTLRVITGCGSKGLGRSKVKQSAYWARFFGSNLKP
ncbi:SMR domain-containing protein At5g58720 isoform X2 [Carica papaya]|uniref:SMR domain-containing protein At5g58720 isoform X2 n=1 Tax=Carica papaya TaxID=3649 RepID=UPI000B8C6F2B|nr:SMR domain-containing protein At5g58720 isoform X2 [Carica papaya]